MTVCLLGCNKNKDYTQIDEDLIQEYIADNNLDAIATGSGLYYVIETTGNGIFPNLSSFNILIIGIKEVNPSSYNILITSIGCHSFMWMCIICWPHCT